MRGRGRGREDHRGLETAGVRQAEINMEDKKDSVMRVFDVIKCYSRFLYKNLNLNLMCGSLTYQ